jgi:protein O-GlcNAc transferase
MESIADALDLCRCGRAEEAAALCEGLLTRSPNHADALALLADIRLTGGQADAAIPYLSNLARLRPEDAANHRRLGGALLATGRARDAATTFRRAIELAPQNVRAHNNLGQALLQLGDVPGAMRCFEDAVGLDPSYAIGHSNLGQALITNGQFDRAIASLDRAVSLDRNLVAARINLSIAYERQGRLPEALRTYDETLQSSPAQADAWTGRGALLSKLHRLTAALESFDAALRLRPDHSATLAHKASVLLMLERAQEALECVCQALGKEPDFVEALDIQADALCKLHRPAEALRCLERALALKPDYLEGWCHRAVVHQHLGEDDLAVNCYRQALSFDPNSMAALCGLISAHIPAVPSSDSEAAQARIEFDRELAAFEQWLVDRKVGEAEAWTMAKQPFFYISYREESSREQLQRYRAMSTERLARSIDIGGVRLAEAADASRPRFKLGIVSAHVFDHSVFNAITQGWLQRLNRDEFEISLFSLGARQDATTRSAAAAADHFEAEGRTPSEWARLIHARHLDALIFPEVGIDRSTLALAGLRLAPRQLAAWGHPETTGLPTIDQYLSAELFEPADAAEHYSEQLVRLPHLGVYYQPYSIETEAARWEEFGVSEGPVLLCPGTPFKYAPQDDWVWVEIASRLGRCRLVFFEHERSDLSRKLQARLAGAFRRAGLDPDRYLRWVPWLPRGTFLSLLGQADLYLDTLGFSGFNTLMQAVQAHLPCITHEGRFLRGRLGSGILRRIGMDELVAADRREYVDIAVKLAESPAHRNELRRRLRQAEHLAYGDQTAVDALSTLLLDPRALLGPAGERSRPTAR